MLVFDLESDGLLDDVTKIYCVSYTSDGEDIKTTTDCKEMVEVLSSSDTLIGHNIGTYDLLALKKVLGFDYKGLIIDTLWLSWYLDPNRIKHGLEDYGEDHGYPKVKVEDHEWKEENLPLMVERCERDVKINWLVWKKQRKMLEELYG